MKTMNDKDIAEFIKLFENLPAAEGEPDEEEDGPLAFSEAQDMADQLWDFLGKLHAEDLKGHANSSTSLQQIDKKLREIEERIRGTSLVAVVIVCMFSFLMMVILRGCGG